MATAEIQTTNIAADSKGDPTAERSAASAVQSQKDRGAEESEGGWNEKLAGSGAFGGLILAVLAYIAATFHSNAVANSINIVIVLLGVASGWLLGIMVSPYSLDEKENFNAYAKAFGVFASGYLVAKVDKVVEHMFSENFILDPSNGFRLVAFLVALLVALIVTFVFRRYLR
jgi:uncharacterized membrane protein